ncbi:MAG TPA: NAD-dependent epimerase/dehydratase family protein [Solirubrobacterales bacterium]|nr:NAD-dependent epimerase/dehydratase family protein [Solirubrobacterales bacterium]
MGQTLVTGGSGFLGSHVVRALAARGDELRLLARRSANLDLLDGIEFERVTGDITDRRAVRRAMDGVSRVFNVAGRTSLRGRDREAVFAANLTGARILFEEALEAGAERVVHTSTVGAIGVAKPGGTADEKTPFEIGHLGLAYVNSKHEAELEAFRLAAHGLPVVIVNPTFVLGPDDPTGTSMGLVRRFLRGQIPAYVGGALNIVDVRDVATGHLLADERGKVGERYILGGRNFTLDRLFADLARLSGVAPPPLKLPTRVALGGLEAARIARVPLPTVPEEVRSAALWWTYRNTKAKRELGFSPRPHEETLTDAISWQREQLGGRVATGGGPAVLRAANSALRAAERLVGR